MYKFEIDLDDNLFTEGTVTIETNDFQVISILQEFIEFQQENGWSVDYEAVEDDEYDEEEDEDEDDEVITFSLDQEEDPE